MSKRYHNLLTIKKYKNLTNFLTKEIYNENNIFHMFEKLF